MLELPCHTSRYPFIPLLNKVHLNSVTEMVLKPSLETNPFQDGQLYKDKDKTNSDK